MVVLMIDDEIKVIYTKHARERISIRSISEQLVLNVLRKPDKLLPAKQGRMRVIKKVDGDRISVIYVMENNNFVIITAYWGE